MSQRATRLALVLGAFVAGLVLCFGVIVLVTGSRSATGALQVPAIGGPFHLVDQDGRPASDQDLKGKPFLVFFGFTYCPEICPTTLFDISEVLRNLGPDAQKVSALFVTVDPERDAPAAMKDYLSSFDPHLVGLTGDPAAIAAVAKEYRVYLKKVPLDNGDYTMDHTALVYLMDKDGRFVTPFSLKRTTEASVADLRKRL